MTLTELREEVLVTIGVGEAEALDAPEMLIVDQLAAGAVMVALFQYRCCGRLR